ncbi:MAG: hypothetical protein JWR51_1909 [Devosia sp.]|uniref:hypothetical protein n=1 Tax=Devosia sp. TaxID=1871048 RepID=UPI0026059841|nr:hypothetical protein [Devosia sp.]MDB5528806.1 hypothetical protein [Devosia sp.]
MLARLSFALLCACLVATPALAKDKTAFSCTGVFGPDSSEALLIKTYGADNVVTGQVPGAEGIDMLATTVFPNDPDKTMVFGWMNEETREGLGFVDLPPSIEGPHGVHIGMSVADVLAINGQPFNIGGFWWDYGGYAQIEQGTLANADDATCFLSLRFSPAEEYPQDLDVSAVSGEVSIPADEPLLEKLDTRLTVVSVGFPSAEAE